MATTTTTDSTLLLRAIYASSSGQWGTTGQLITHDERQQAFRVLQDFSQRYDGRVPLALEWLQTPTLTLATPAEPLDVTMPAKLYACEIVADSLKKSQYAQWSEPDRLRLRQAVMVAAQQRARQPISIITTNPLANKLASLLAELVVRDFPQRWTTCISDLFSQLWTNPQLQESNGGSAAAAAGGGGGALQIGNRMCLQVLQLVAEDCTDSDFNSKVGVRHTIDHVVNIDLLQWHDRKTHQSISFLVRIHFFRFRPNGGTIFC